MPMPVPLESRAEYQKSSSVTADISALRQRSLNEHEAYQLARNVFQCWNYGYMQPCWVFKIRSSILPCPQRQYSRDSTEQGLAA